MAASGPAGATAERALELLCRASGGAGAVLMEAMAVHMLARTVEGTSGLGHLRQGGHGPMVGMQRAWAAQGRSVHTVAHGDPGRPHG